MTSLHPDSSTWPLTLDEAAERLLGWLSERDRLTLRDTHEDDLVGFHLGLGMSIRHSFGLWRGNRELMASCGKTTADEASGAIIREVWRRLQARAPDRPMPALFVPRDDLTRYLLQHYRHLLTADERDLLAHDEWFVVGGPDDPDRLGLARESAPPELRQRVARGREALYREIVSRVLQQHATEVVINRCPVCEGVCRTPRAKQCWQCGHDWHELEKV